MGNVGIGTTSLVDKLTVQGDARLQRSNNSNDLSTFTIEGAQITGNAPFAQINFRNFDAGTDYLAASIIASNGLGSSDGELRFYTTSTGNVGGYDTQALRINRTGRVGILTGSDNLLYTFQIGASGDGTEAIANSWATWSDRRLKKKFELLDAPLEKLSQLNGYYYHWKGKNKDKSRQVGVIAQEVEAVLPEVVKTNDAGMKSVDYAKIVALLIEVNKEQQKLLDNSIEQTQLLQARLASLEMQIAELTDSVSNVRHQAQK